MQLWKVLFVYPQGDKIIFLLNVTQKLSSVFCLKPIRILVGIKSMYLSRLMALRLSMDTVEHMMSKGYPGVETKDPAALEAVDDSSKRHDDSGPRGNTVINLGAISLDRYRLLVPTLWKISFVFKTPCTISSIHMIYHST
jgi:hypothetical protein